MNIAHRTLCRSGNDVPAGTSFSVTSSATASPGAMVASAEVREVPRPIDLLDGFVSASDGSDAVTSSATTRTSNLVLSRIGNIKITLKTGAQPSKNTMQILLELARATPGSVLLATHGRFLIAGLSSALPEEFNATISLITVCTACGQSVPEDVIRGIADAYDRTSDGARKFALMSLALPLMVASPLALFILDRRQIGQDMRSAVADKDSVPISEDEWSALQDFETEEEDLKGFQEVAFALFDAVARSSKCTSELLLMAERAVALTLQRDADPKDIQQAMDELKAALKAVGLE